MAQGYKLYSLRDIMEKVPPDKIRLCMEELAVTMEVLALQRADAIKAAGGDASLAFEFPDGFEWCESSTGGPGLIAWQSTRQRVEKARG